MKAIYTGICNVKKGHEQRVFMMDPPHCGYEFVMVSARNFEEFTFRLAQSIRVPAPFLGSDPMAGEETYIFGCDPTGEITDWEELPGSYKGGMSHAEALANAGYTIVSSVEELKEEE
jgi:hypothetical protein